MQNDLWGRTFQNWLLTAHKSVTNIHTLNTHINTYLYIGTTYILFYKKNDESITFKFWVKHFYLIWKNLITKKKYVLINTVFLPDRNRLFWSNLKHCSEERAKFRQVISKESKRVRAKEYWENLGEVWREEPGNRNFRIIRTLKK